MTPSPKEGSFDLAELINFIEGHGSRETFLNEPPKYNYNKVPQSRDQRDDDQDPAQTIRSSNIVKDPEISKTVSLSRGGWRPGRGHRS